MSVSQKEKSVPQNRAQGVELLVKCIHFLTKPTKCLFNHTLLLEPLIKLLPIIKSTCSKLDKNLNILHNNKIITVKIYEKELAASVEIARF